jgi:hypothetical protein
LLAAAVVVLTEAVVRALVDTALLLEPLVVMLLRNQNLD